MRMVLVSLLVFGFVSTWAHAADRQDELFAAWEKAQREVKSLVVEFTEVIVDPVFRTVEKGKGTFRLLRTEKGDFVATYSVTYKAKGEKPRTVNGLHSDGKTYLLDSEKKIALRWHHPEAKLLEDLEQYLNPLLVLLDQKRARAEYELEVIKQEEWYTYLTVKPKEAKQRGWFSVDFKQGRVVLAKKDLGNVPKNMPCQLWFSRTTHGQGESTLEITKWVLNGSEAPKLEEFTRPENRPGWQVVESWPHETDK